MMRLVHGSPHLPRHELIEQGGESDQERQANELSVSGRDRDCPGSFLSDRARTHRHGYCAHAGIIARKLPLTNSPSRTGAELKLQTANGWKHLKTSPGLTYVSQVRSSGRSGGDSKHGPGTCQADCYIARMRHGFRGKHFA